MPPAAISTTPPTPHPLQDEPDHRWHVLGVCPALVEHFLEPGLSREAILLDDAAQVGPNALAPEREPEPPPGAVGVGQRGAHVRAR